MKTPREFAVYDLAYLRGMRYAMHEATEAMESKRVNTPGELEEFLEGKVFHYIRRFGVPEETVAKL